jgi:hypothetical protein
MKNTETSPSAVLKKSQPKRFDLVIPSTVAAWTFAGEASARSRY